MTNYVVMKVEVWSIGEIFDEYKGIEEEYVKRINRYLPITALWLPSRAKNLTDPHTIKKTESIQILEKLKPDDYLILLDEAGKVFGSKQFARQLDITLMKSGSRIIFLLGGAYGFHSDAYSRAQEKWSLSSLTFPHQMARIIMLEQLYRACTILRHQPYHH